MLIVVLCPSCGDAAVAGGERTQPGAVALFSGQDKATILPTSTASTGRARPPVPSSPGRKEHFCTASLHLTLLYGAPKAGPCTHPQQTQRDKCCWVHTCAGSLECIGVIFPQNFMAQKGRVVGSLSPPQHMQQTPWRWLLC